MTKKFVPDCSLSDLDAQDDYIYWAYLYFYQTDNLPFPRFYKLTNGRVPPANFRNLSTNALEKLKFLYKEGFFIYKVLKCSWEEFLLAITINRSVYPSYRDSKKSYRGGRWYWDHGVEFREKLSYQKRPHHQKKELTEKESFNKSWREQKGFNKDYRKQNRSLYGKRKTNAKKFSNRTYRRIEKRLIQSGQYDLLSSQKDKSIFDPWDWD